ncbi:uncharacterized protein LY89DRAFT_669023 [Mollisia scopiformis]|uniref:BTB domain-containing protein n=1 Tax=Mollisia scopiformis TaxID=149040 RepID=A0A194XC37_MOLSC|nr:uncharacterized protein LY89DRAFT_669023 [Mollisia scopiformis]KUJ17730.1 hypothetical protein LY89DRAFT_669023 [Mollisia scopiformis]
MDAVSSLKGLFESGKYADLTIRCGGAVHKVHCAVVCSRSKFLEKAVDGQFKEAALRDIDLSEDEQPIVREMIRYLYTDDYDHNPYEQGGLAPGYECHISPEAENSLASPDHRLLDGTNEACCLMFHVKMYVAGDKYDIPGLRTLVTEKYQHCVAEYWNSTTFSHAALHLWDNTVESDRQLRNVVIQAAHDNLDELLDRGEFRDLMQSRGDFCFDIVHCQTVSRTLILWQSV